MLGKNISKVAKFQNLVPKCCKIRKNSLAKFANFLIVLRAEIVNKAIFSTQYNIFQPNFRILLLFIKGSFREFRLYCRDQKFVYNANCPFVFKRLRASLCAKFNLQSSQASTLENLFFVAIWHRLVRRISQTKHLMPSCVQLSVLVALGLAAGRLDTELELRACACTLLLVDPRGDGVELVAIVPLVDGVEEEFN